MCSRTDRARAASATASTPARSSSTSSRASRVGGRHASRAARQTAGITASVTAPASERELIRRSRGGDEEAFAELVRMHAGRVYGALRRFGLDAGHADEVAQEVFLRAWRGLAR